MIVMICAMGAIMAIYVATTREHVYRSAALIQIELPLVQNMIGAKAADTTHELQLIRHRVLARDRMIDLVKTYNLSSGDTADTLTQTAETLRTNIDIRPLYDQDGVWAANAPLWPHRRGP